MKIGIIADTHDHIEHTKKAMLVFEQHQVEHLIHCGDFCSPFMMQQFKSIPTSAVFGNNDGDIFLLQKKADEFDVKLLGGFAEMNVSGKKIAVYHGTYEPITQALIHCGAYDWVVSGHTHQAKHERVGKTWHFNPGSANGFGKSATVLILDVQTDSFSLISLD